MSPRFASGITAARAASTTDVFEARTRRPRALEERTCGLTATTYLETRVDQPRHMRPSSRRLPPGKRLRLSYGEMLRAISPI